ncbi:MAG: protein arginine kinase [Clostridia bacterium]
MNEREAPEQEVVVSSRVRLARNFSDRPFTPLMNAELAQQNIERVLGALDAGDDKRYDFYRMNELSEEMRASLVERHLISNDLTKNLDWAAALIDKAQCVSVMINEEDHLRIQGLLPGLQLERAAELAFQVDDQMSAHAEFAFDSQWGYLTSCPTNTGTGMRASTMLHLPALNAAGQIGQIGQAIAKLGMTMRGLDGEGSDAVGCMYLISNQVTLGRAEEDILRSLIAATMQVSGHERATREQMLSQDATGVTDKLMRSLGILKYARVMTPTEMMTRMSDLRLAVTLGLADCPLPEIDRWTIELKTGTLSARSAEKLSERARDVLRAELLREKLRAV